MALSKSQLALLTYLLNYMYECPLYPRTNYDTACNTNPITQTYDFIIIGGGSAGSTIANRLSENPNWKILLIEAGDAPSNLTEAPGTFVHIQGTKEDWRFKSEQGNFCKGFVDCRCKFPQGMMLGGSSSMNAMVALKGVDRDYNHWAERGNTGWDWKSMQTYFDKLTTNMKTGVYPNTAPIRKLIEDSAKLLGEKVKPDNSWTGYFDVGMTIWERQRFNAAKGYIVSARDRTNLCVLTKSQVAKILFSSSLDKKPKAVGVELVDEVKIYADKEVIVSAGAINTPKLLMLSGIGPENHLKSLKIPIIRNLPVGKNFQDHLVHLGLFIELPNEVIPGDYMENVKKYCESREGPISQANLLGFIGFINTRNNSFYPDIQIHHIIIPKEADYHLPNNLEQRGYNQESQDSLIEINKNSTLLQIMLILLNPKSRGDIRLQSENPNIAPLINPGYMTDMFNQDEETMLQGINYIKRMVAQEPFVNAKAKIVNFRVPNCRYFWFNTREYWKCSLRNFGSTIFHPSGTCKMGPGNDSEAVVDSNLKVRGVDRLRVVDASIMPKVVSCNTNIPIIAIAEKAADLIKLSNVS